MQILQFVDSAVITAAAAKTILFPSRKRIVGVRWTGYFVEAAATAGLRFDLSLSPTDLYNYDGTDSVIDSYSFHAQFISNASTMRHDFNDWHPMDFTLEAGTYLYLHRTIQSAGPTSHLTRFFIHTA